MEIGTMTNMRSSFQGSAQKTFALEATRRLRAVGSASDLRGGIAGKGDGGQAAPNGRAAELLADIRNGKRRAPLVCRTA